MGSQVWILHFFTLIYKTKIGPNLDRLHMKQQKIIEDNPMMQGLVSLHRYYIWANRMRTHFDEIISNNYNTPAAEIEATLYMSYWYGGLYVVIEGWQELGLIDDRIDELLGSPNIKLLKRYRHGVFHFQKNYFDERFVGFMRDGNNAVSWVRTLNLEFGRYFLVKGKTKYSNS